MELDVNGIKGLKAGNTVKCVDKGFGKVKDKVYIGKFMYREGGILMVMGYEQGKEDKNNVNELRVNTNQYAISRSRLTGKMLEYVNEYFNGYTHYIKQLNERNKLK